MELPESPEWVTSVKSVTMQTHDEHVPRSLGRDVSVLLITEVK